MEHSRIPILGLDYRTIDHETKPGVCRVLDNLYPSGEATFPTWRPTRKPNVIVARTKEFQVIDGYVWHRLNLPSLFVALAHSDNDDDIILTVELAPDGRSADINTLTVLWRFGDTNLDRVATFAQAGEIIVVSVGVPSTQERMLMIRMIDDDVVCMDFNANIPFPRLQVTSVDTADDDSTHNSTLTASSAYFGVRVAWELNDGTLMGVSPLLVFENAKKNTKWRIMHFGPEASATYSDPNWKRLIRGLSIYISPPITSDTPLGVIPDRLANESLFYKIATLEKIFEGLPTYVFDEEWDQISTKELLDSDLILSRKSMLAQTLFSYNKRTMYGGIQYVFQAPLRLDGKSMTEEDTGIGGGGGGIVIPKADWLGVTIQTAPWEYRNWDPNQPSQYIVGTTPDGKSILRHAFKYALDWKMPDSLPSEFIFQSMEMQRRIRYTRFDQTNYWQGGGEITEITHQDWTTIGNIQKQGDASETEYTDDSYIDVVHPTLTLFEWIYNIRIDYRIRVRYANNTLSDWVDSALLGAVPKPVADLTVEVTGGDDTWNDNPAGTNSGYMWVSNYWAKIAWKAPDINETHRGIETYKIYRDWSWTVRRPGGDQETKTGSQFIAALPGSALGYEDGTPQAALILQSGEAVIGMSLVYVIEANFYGGGVASATVQWDAPKPVAKETMDVIGGETYINDTIIPVLHKYQALVKLVWQAPLNAATHKLVGYRVLREWGYTRRTIQTDYSLVPPVPKPVDTIIVNPMAELAIVEPTVLEWNDEIVAAEQARYVMKDEGDLNGWIHYRITAIYEGRTIEPRTDFTWTAP